VPARISAFNGQKLKRLDIPNKEMADAALAAVKAGQFKVAAVEAKPTKRNPPPPFTTSTLQQEAARKLFFNASRTMQVAQRLYEAGHITYMRTDGVSMDEGAVRDIRNTINKDFGGKYVPDAPRRYTSKIKNAQEAHEAIRPTDPSNSPSGLSLDGDQAKLYELVWKRAMASQMEAASLERTSVDFTEPTGKVELRASGQVILFDGFLALYSEGRDDENADDDENRRLPQMKQGEAMKVADAKAAQHFTEPPPRFSEASLVKKLEELGIGRPSTYAATIEKLRERNYVHTDKNRFIPDDRGRLVTAFLENFFKRYVEYDFTADLEEKLDEVASGDLSWKKLMREFWTEFHAAVDGMSELRVTNVLDALNESLGPHIFPPREDGGDPRTCQVCGTGNLSLKLGKFGAFIGCSNYPECKYTRQLAPAEANEAAADRVLGQDAQGRDVSQKVGRFGPYLELAAEESGKPKRASIPKGKDPQSIDLAYALQLLSMPREIGMHPSLHEMILAGLGRFGPYLQMKNPEDGKMIYANLQSVDDALEIQMNRAVALIDEKKNNPRSRFQRGAPAPLKVLGDSPVTGKSVNVMSGRYGPYVTDGETNATIPKEHKPEELTLDIALPLLAARAEMGGGKKKKKAPAKKAAVKKEVEKTATALKKATKPAAKKPAVPKTAKKAPAKKAAPKKKAAG
jgi:DNA topoisomerase-1